MKINVKAKNRVILEHDGKFLRVETTDGKKGFRLYFSSDARINNGVIRWGKMPTMVRKITIV